MPSTYPNPSIPADLLAMYRMHQNRLPPLSTLCADAMRGALRAIGVEPPSAPPPARTAAATAARSAARSEAAMPIEVGRHRLLCGDITQGAAARMLRGDAADVVYSDPPWGPGNQRYWHTMNARGSVPRTSWPSFLAAFCGVCAAHRRPDAPVFVEMGLRWVDELDAAMRSVGLEPRRRWRILYGPKRKPLPNVLSLFGPRDVEVTMPDPPHGEPVTRAALAAVVRPGSIVLDPCTGLGMTARLTHALGGAFRGTELNAARLARTVAWLEKRP